MRKIVVLEFVSLDGVIQAPGSPTEDTSGDFKFGGWTVPFSDTMSEQEMAKQMSQTYGLLLGRKTYDIWVNFWPNHTEGWPQVNEIPKYVMSKTLTNPTWKNTNVLKDIEELKKLKGSDGPDLQVYGSSGLVHTLLQHDLIDELWLKIYPVILGGGKRLFSESAMSGSFELVESKTTSTGVIFASYKRAGEIKTGSF